MARSIKKGPYVFDKLLVKVQKLNESGKNMYVVEVDKNIYIFDAGLKYPKDRFLGIDYIIPSFDYLKENIKMIKFFELIYKSNHFPH